MIDVVNYAQDKSTRDNQPIVLARLPHVEAVPSAPKNTAARQTAPQPESLPIPETIPQLDLRSQIEQRTHLHIADTPSDSQASLASHYADQLHENQRLNPTLHPESAPKQRSRKSRTSRSTVASPASFSEKLFKLQAQLAPHAGLIVAMALIASAGLLYWMIVGPADVTVPNYQNSGFEMQSGGFDAMSDYQPDFSAGVEPADGTLDSATDEWTQMQLPTPQQFDDSSASIAEMDQLESSPADRTPSLRMLPPVSELSHETSNGPTTFPTTSNPNSLDYSKLVSPSTEMARRPTDSTNQ